MFPFYQKKISFKAALSNPFATRNVANGHLNVANGLFSKHLKIRLIWTTPRLMNYPMQKYVFPFNILFEYEKNVKRNGPGCKICLKAWAY